jgi:hypothetical protein
MTSALEKSLKGISICTVPYSESIPDNLSKNSFEQSISLA